MIRLPGSTRKAGLSALIALSATLSHAHAGDSPFSADALSILKGPLSFRAGGVTYQLRGSVDEAVHTDLRTDNSELRTTAGFEISAESELENRLTIGAAYSGKFETDPGNIADVGGDRKDEKYSDSVSVFVSGALGTLRGGNVTDLVTNETIRKEVVGNAVLAFDGALGHFEDWGGGYSGRFGPMVVSAVVDEDLNVGAGLRLSRPIGNKDVGFGLRGSTGKYLSEDQTTTFDTHAVIASADVIYGSSLFDIALGYEHFSAGEIDAVRLYGSLGVQHKIGAVTVSAHGHYGHLAGNEEAAVALGGRYDIARGLSANVGLNYARLQASIDGVNMVSKDALEAVFSIRYEF